MSKKIEPKKKAAAGTGRTAPFVLPPLNGNGWLFLKNFRFQALVVVLIGALFYGSTYKNQYALDDDIIMKQNMYVQKGFSGIGDILSNDAYKSYYESMGVEQQLAGGRYRPLSIITFAMEQSIFGKCYGEEYTSVRDSLFALQKQGVNDATTGRLINRKNELDKKISETNLKVAPIRHIMQVFWFVLSMVVLLWLLREHIFRGNTDIAFLAVLLFTIHPIHTEVVANVKSRDEIFSLLFIALSFIFFFRYDLKRQMKDVVWGAVCFFLALLSKEYAVALLVLIPASLMIFHKRKLSELFYLAIPVAGVMLLYVIFRFSALGGAVSAPVDKNKQDVLNDPYLYANDAQTLASKLNRLDDYIWLLIFPWPLVSDYSYQTFAYSNIFDLGVLLSLAVNIGLVILMIRLCVTRHPMAFALLLYFGFFAMICNIFFDIGATMGERLIYHSSLGFCMALAWLLVKGVEKIKTQQAVILTIVFVIISIPAWMVTQQRNTAWQNDFTLFTTDVKTHPKSALTNGNAGSQYMNKGLYFLGRDTVIGKDTIHQFGRDTVKVHRYADTASFYLQRATTIHKKYVNGYLNLGLCYYYREQYDAAADSWSHAYDYFPSNNILLSYEQMFLAQANNHAVKKDYPGAAYFLRLATISMPNDAKAWSDYAGASFMARDFTTAKSAFAQAMQLIDGQIGQLNKSGNVNSQQVQALNSQKQNLQMGFNVATYNEKFLLAWQKDTMNADSTLMLARSYMGTGEFYPTSRRLLNHALEIRPGDARAKHLLDSLGILEEKLKVPATPAISNIKK